MAEKLQKIKEVNKRRGNPGDSINTVMDGRYNSTTIANRKKPAHSMRDDDSEGVHHSSSHPKQAMLDGAWLRGKGMEVECAGGHPDCTANTYRQAPLSEYELSKAIGAQISVEDAYVRYITTDGDSQSAVGVAEAMRLFDPKLKVERKADPVNLSQAQFRQCYNAQFSSDNCPMMPVELQH